MLTARDGVDAYLRDGCGRCARYRTDACKVHQLPDVLVGLRALARGAGLDETVKWGSPCYTLDGRNVAMIGAFEQRVVMSFFRGTELADPHGLLQPAGPNARVARLVELRSLEALRAARPGIEALLTAAIALERSGAKRPPRPADAEPLPDELARQLASDPTLRAAFDALSPGRRRSHALHVGGAKLPETRSRRALACVPDILAGRGFRER